MRDRALLIHCARVYLRECQLRRHSAVDRNFYWRLLDWAQRCRREAFKPAEPSEPAAQLELFA